MTQNFTVRTSTNSKFELMAIFHNDQIKDKFPNFRRSNDPSHPNLMTTDHEYNDEALKLFNLLDSSELIEDIGFDTHDNIIYFNFTQIKCDEKAFELAYLLADEQPVETIQNYLLISGDDEYFTINDDEYLVLTDSEADTRNEDSATSIVEDCYECNYPEPYKSKAQEAFVQAIINEGDRGQQLSGYDGREQETANYFVYRTN